MGAATAAVVLAADTAAAVATTASARMSCRRAVDPEDIVCLPYLGGRPGLLAGRSAPWTELEEMLAFDRWI
ncbi:hypothetical protein Xph01_57410 [Micromonospora phaseoli]|nr:hypothetical protein Xph01_57410 [Micromonospora phaseoli]